MDVVVSSVRPSAGRRGLVVMPFVDEEFVLVATPTTARSVDQDRLAEDPRGPGPSAARGLRP
ncbi:hypothetical protein ACFQ3Z_33925 [Streptomyces nogalater]